MCLMLQDTMIQTGDTPTSVRYENFQDDGDSETQVPLCDSPPDPVEDAITRTVVTWSPPGGDLFNLTLWLVTHVMWWKMW